VPKDTIFANDDSCKDAVGCHSLRGYGARCPNILWTANLTHLLQDGCCEGGRRGQGDTHCIPGANAIQRISW
jgi:hypothetical protein